MMKIHTTQDLSVLARQQQLSPINSVSLSELRFGQQNVIPETKQENSADKEKKKPNYRLINALVLLSGVATIGALAAALARQKKVLIKPEELKKTISTVKDTKVGNIKETATIEETRWHRFLDSKFFDTLLRWSENEPVMQSAIAALICIILRPATIMALPSKNGKENNMYASAHSISSGIIGLFTSLLITQPFKSGTSYTMKHMYKEFSEDALKRLHPRLDIKSTKNAEKGLWKFADGNKFIDDYKDVEKIPMLQPLNDISASSFKIFGADVDWKAYKGKSFNEVFTRDGKSLYDAIDWERLGIVVEQEYTGAAQPSKKMLKECTGKAPVLLRDLDRGFLEKVIKDADKDSYWRKLDLNSVYENGQVVDFRKWKEIGSGEQWKLDLDNAYLSSPYDTITYKPRISGRHRIEPTGEIKYAAYLKNGKDGKLGTVVDEVMAETQKRNEVRDKSITWFPDILTRPLMATATIALIPLALKKVFHIEKKKTAVNPPAQENQIQNDAVKAEESEIKTDKNTAFKGESSNDNENNNQELSFKGKGNGKPNEEEVKGLKKLIQDWIIKPLAKYYGKPMYESKAVHRMADRMSRVPGGMTNHMSSLGALLTSSVYMYQTLHKKDLDEDRRRTLAINQGFCFVVPTICAYTVDKLLKDWTKENIEYIYAGLQERKIKFAKLDPKKAARIEELQNNLGKRLNSVRTLITLAIFATIYRYVAPVLITPLANKIGDNITAKKHAQAEAEKANAETKTVSMNSDNPPESEESKAYHSAA